MLGFVYIAETRQLVNIVQGTQELWTAETTMETETLR